MPKLNVKSKLKRKEVITYNKILQRHKFNAGGNGGKLIAPKVLKNVKTPIEFHEISSTVNTENSPYLQTRNQEMADEENSLPKVMKNPYNFVDDTTYNSTLTKIIGESTSHSNTLTNSFNPTTLPQFLRDNIGTVIASTVAGASMFARTSKIVINNILRK